MLTGQTQTHFYTNRDSITSIEDFCQKIRLFFKNPKWECLNLIKWQTVSLADTIAANPTLSTTECLCKICTEIDKLERNVNLVYHQPIYVQENIMRVCQGHQALVAGLTNLLLEISHMVNSPCSSIINYEAVHKSSFTKNYVQAGPIGKMMRHFLLTGNIDEIDLCVGDIEVHPNEFLILANSTH